jgi:hypothetical protein
MIATGQIASIALLAIPAILLLTETSAAQRPAEQSPPSLIVTPSTSIAISGPPGGPFSPSLIEYRISASMGTVSYSIRTPSWLTASSTVGATDAKGVTITLTVNASAASLSPGTYGPGVAFTNVSNGRGSATRPARLIVGGPSPPRPTGQIERGPSPPRPTGQIERGPSPSRPTGQIERGRGGYLLDDHGGYLLDDRGGRLLGQ